MEQLINNTIKQLNNHFIINDTQISALVAFYKLITEKNKQMNLTRITDKTEFVIKHIIDSIAPIFKLNSKPKTILDIGSGAGFPGIIIKIFFPEIFVILVESITKKANFLKEVVQSLNLKGIIVLNKRSETITNADIGEKHIDLVTNRAVTSLAKVTSILPKIISKQTIVLCYKGPGLEAELLDFNKVKQRFNYQVLADYELPSQMGKRTYVVLRLKV